MAQKDYIVEGRSFRTEGDYKRALKDKETIDRLRIESAGYTSEKLTLLRDEIRSGKYRFFTLLGQDFEDELNDRIKQGGTSVTNGGKRSVKSKSAIAKGKNNKSASVKSSAVKVSDEEVQLELKRREKRRKLMIVVCALMAVACLGYLGIYTYYGQRTQNSYEELLALKEQAPEKRH